MLPIIRILLRPVPIKCGASQQHQGNRRRHRHENTDEDFMEGEAVAGDGEIDDRGHDDAAGARPPFQLSRFQPSSRQFSGFSLYCGSFVHLQHSALLDRTLAEVFPRVAAHPAAARFRCIDYTPSLVIG